MAKDEAGLKNVAKVAKHLAILRPYLDGEVPLTEAAAATSIPRRTEDAGLPVSVLVIGAT